MKKSERFGLVLSPVEKQMLRRLAEQERLSAAAVVRRLIWCGAKRQDITVDQGEAAQAHPVVDGGRVSDNKYEGEGEP